MWSWSPPQRKDPDPVAAEPIFTRLLREWNHPPLYVRLIDERGHPPWLRPAPSLRLLARPRDPMVPRVRYAPERPPWGRQSVIWAAHRRRMS